jgi:NADH-quinone oxidoreductase subunit M
MDVMIGVALVLGLPLLGAVVLAFFGCRSSPAFGWAAFAVSAVSAVAACVMAATSWGQVLVTRYTWAESLNMGLSFRADALSLLALVAITVLTSLALLYGVSYMTRRGGGSASFYAWMLLFLTGMAGVALAADTIEFYVFWEFMLIPSAALLAFWGEGAHARRTAIKYFIFTHVGAVAILVAILWTFWATWTTDISLLREAFSQGDQNVLLVIAWLFVAGFAVKLAIFPVHTWLPDAYADAPLPVAVAMAGAMMGAGIYGLVRFVFTPFPLAVIQRMTLPLLVLALVTQYYGAVMALAQRGVRRIVAYSSMSQMGYVLFGVASAAALGVGGSVFHLLNHGIAKALLFMSMGAVILSTGAESLDQMGGLARRMPLTALACSVAALSLAGAPPLGGFQSEWMIFAGGFGGGHAVLTGLAIAGSVLTAWYALWLVKRVFFGPERPELETASEAGAGLLVPMLALCVAALVVGVYPGPFVQWVREAVQLFAMSF